MQQLGTYQQTIGYRQKSATPIYGVRQKFLPLAGKEFTQVLVTAFGDLAWINVDRQDVSVTAEHAIWQEAAMAGLE